MSGVREVAFEASIMLHGGANVPADFAVFTEGGSCLGGKKMSNNFGARWSDWGAVEVKVAVERGMRGKGWMDARGAKEI